MAKDDFRVDGMDFDKGLDMDFDMDFSPKSMSQMSKREVVTETAKGAFEGAKDNLLASDKWLSSVKDRLPRGYKSSWDAYDETTKTLSVLYNQAQKEIKPALGEITTKLDNLVPENAKFLKGISSSLRDMFAESSRYGRSDEDPEDQGVQSMLSELMAKHAVASEDAAVAREALNQRVEQTRHEGMIKYFSRMDRNLNKIGTVVSGFGIEVAKKALELQFRQYSVLGQIHLEQKRQGEMLLSQLSDIKLNTGLPEFKKISISDRFQEEMSARITGSITDKLFDGKSPIGTMLSKIKEDGSRLISDIAMGLQFGIMGVDSAEMALDGTMTGSSAPKTVGNFIGDMLGSKFREVIMDKVAPAFLKDQAFNAFSERLQKYVMAPGYALDDLQKTSLWKEIVRLGYEDEAMDFVNYLRSAATPRQNLGRLTGAGSVDLSDNLDNTVSNKYLNTVQTSVVPGYLARILREVTRLRRKTDDVELLEWDPVNGGFKKEKDLAAVVEDHIRTAVASGGAAYGVKRGAKLVGSHIGVEEDETLDIANLVYDLTTNNDRITSDLILDSDAFKEASPKGKAVLNRLAKSLSDENPTRDTILADLEETISDARARRSNYSAHFQSGIDSGLERHYRKMGALEMVDGQLRISDEFRKSMSRYEAGREYVPVEELEGIERARRQDAIDKRDEEAKNKARAERITNMFSFGRSRSDVVSPGEEGKAERPSDVELKEGFVSVKGKDALEGVKNIPISSWNYKDPYKHGGGRHIGGMAQDINKQFGDEAAPGGKKINLVSMNGINMAAIQGLSEQQEVLKKRLDSTRGGDVSGVGSMGSLGLEGKSPLEELIELNKETKALHLTLKEKTFGFPGFDFADFDMAKAKQAFANAGDSVKKHARPLIETGNFYIDLLQSFAVQGLNDIYGGAKKGAIYAKDKAVNFYDEAKSYLHSKKDWIREKKDLFVEKTISFADQALDRGIKFFKEDIPDAFFGTKNFLKKAKEWTKSVVSGPRDVYLRGQSSPVLTAVRMRAGMYANAETGDIIHSLDTLLKTDADIYDIGRKEIALTRSDKADGLYDEEGNTLYTIREAAMGLAKVAAKKIFEKTANGLNSLVEWWKEPSKIGEMLRGFWGGIKDRFSNFDAFSFIDKRQVSILAQIRDLLAIDKRKDLVAHVYDRDLERHDAVDGRDFYSKLTGKKLLGLVSEKPNEPKGSHQTQQTSTETTGSKDVGKTSEGTPGETFDKFLNSLGVGKHLTNFSTAMKGSKNFVGPLQPTDSRNIVRNFMDKMFKKPGTDNEENPVAKGKLQQLYEQLFDWGDVGIGPQKSGREKFDDFFDRMEAGIRNWETKERDPSKSLWGRLKGGTSNLMKNMFMGKGIGFEVQKLLVSEGDGKRIYQLPNGTYEIVDIAEEEAAKAANKNKLSYKLGKKTGQLASSLMGKTNSFMGKAQGFGKKLSGHMSDVFMESGTGIPNQNKLVSDNGKERIYMTPAGVYFTISVEEDEANKWRSMSKFDRAKIKAGQMKDNVKSAIERKFEDLDNRISPYMTLAKGYGDRFVNSGRDAWLQAQLMGKSLSLDARDIYNKIPKSKDELKTLFNSSVASGKDKFEAIKENLTGKKDALVDKAKNIIADPREAGKQLVASLKDIISGLAGVKKDVDAVAIGSDIRPADAGGMNGADIGPRKTWRNRLGNAGRMGLRMVRGVGSLAFSAAGGIGRMIGSLGGKAVNEVGKNDFGTALSRVTGPAKRLGGFNDGIKGFNDRDGDGNRDGGATERLNQLNEEAQIRKEETARKASEAQQRAQGMKYKSQENAIDQLIGATKAAIGGMAGGFGSMLNTAMGIFSSIPTLWKGLKGAGSLLGKGYKAAGRLMGRVGMAGIRTAAGAVAKHGLRVAAIKGLGTVAAAGLGSGSIVGTGVAGAAIVAKGALMALASPWVLGGLAVAGVAYGGFKLYKYLNRNKTDVFQKMRLVQYGFAEEHEEQHKVLALEAFFLDGRVSYGPNPTLQTKEFKIEEIHEIFGIDSKDEERKAKFNIWLNERFRPVLLCHIAAIFKANPNIKLEDADKLKYEELQTYVEGAKFPNGPYQVEESPFGDKVPVVDTSSQIDGLAKAIAESKKAPSGKKATSLAKEVVTDPKLVSVAAANQRARDDAAKRAAEEAAKPAVTKTVSVGPPAPTSSEAEEKVSEALRSDDVGKVPSTGGSGEDSKSKFLAANGSLSLPVAKGPLARPDEGERFLKLKSGVNVSNLHPTVKRYLFAMAAEYGNLTGKQIPINDGWRSYEEQARIFKKKPHLAAEPGKSIHEFGMAFDVDQAVAKELEEMGLFRKYGFTRPVGGEKWHVEPSGIQLDIQRSKTDKKWATDQIEMSPGRGGGGLGSITGTKAKTRNPAMAINLWKNGSSKPIENTRTADAANDSGPSTVGLMIDSKPVQSAAMAANESPFKKITSTRPVMGPDTRSSPIAGVPSEPISENKKSDDGGGTPTTTNSPGGVKPGIQRDPKGIRSDIIKAAERANMDPNVLLLFAAAESAMGQNMKPHTGSAQGPFQFMPATWNEQVRKHGKKYGLAANASPFDTYSAALMTSAYLKQNAGSLNLKGRNPTVVDYYLTHFLGPGGASKFTSLGDDEIAAKHLPSAAKSNPNIFFRNPRSKSDPYTVAEVRQVLEKKFETLSKNYGIDFSGFNGDVSGSSPSAVSSASKPPAVVSGGVTAGSDAAANDAYISPVQEAEQAAVGKRVRSAPVETMRGNDMMASGFTETMTRTADAAEGILTLMQKEMMPVLQGMHDTLKAMYETPKAESTDQGNKGAQKPTKQTSNASQITPSMLERSRKYGT